MGKREEAQKDLVQVWSQVHLAVSFIQTVIHKTVMYKLKMRSGLV